MYLSGDKSSVFGATYMTEAALVLTLRGSARMLLAVLRLGFGVLLKPAQNKVSQQPRQQQNTERLKRYFPHHSLRYQLGKHKKVKPGE